MIPEKTAMENAAERPVPPDGPIDTLIDETAALCAVSLDHPELRRAATLLERLGTTVPEAAGQVAGITEAPASQQGLRALKQAAEAQGVSAGDTSLERLLLLWSARNALQRLPSMPLAPAVKRLLCDQFRFFARPEDAWLRAFDVAGRRFVAFAKLATLRRFPAGQFDWEVSGLPRSWLLKVPPREIPRVAYFVGAKLRGFRPVFFPHLATRRRTPWLFEREANRSYYLMAQCLELQPHVKGFVASSWLRSPDTHRVAPHLAWMGTLFLEHGGLVTTMGPAAPDSGVFHRSPARRQLYEAGQFIPTTGLVIWPRKEMLAWARAHPEFGP